jgi:hypothetical protein
MKISRGRDGFLKCKWKGCSSSVTGPINSLLNHLKSEHNVEATYPREQLRWLGMGKCNFKALQLDRKQLGECSRFRKATLKAPHVKLLQLTTSIVSTFTRDSSWLVKVVRIIFFRLHSATAIGM